MYLGDLTSNEYATNGSKYSQYSPFNKYSSSPPLIVDYYGNVVGRLTLNSYVNGAISPYEIKQLIIDLGF